MLNGIQINKSEKEANIIYSDLYLDIKNPVIYVPPYCHQIYCLISETPKFLRKWCHRNKIAKKRLKEFLETEWIPYIHDQQEKIRQQKRKESKRKIEKAFEVLEQEFQLFDEDEYQELSQAHGFKRICRNKE